MRARGLPAILAALLASAALTGSLLTASASASAPRRAASATPKVHRGGTYRTAATSFGLSDDLDPTGEYQTGFAWGVYDAILRTLVSYDGVAGAAGTVVHPDLATSVPTPTDNGLTYTFHLKTGIRFGPPVNSEITSKDILFAFQRINYAPLAAQYGFYYDGVIKGMTGKATSMTAPISGIQTPNATTIIFHLTRPTGDFLYRLALDATAPVPASVGACFPKAGSYGRDVIASGPYMIQGEQDLDISSCSTIKPEPGFDPTSHLTLVRNPNYNAKTDSPAMRENYVDGVDIAVDSNLSDIFDKIGNGELDGSVFNSPPAVMIHNYQTNSSLTKYLHATPVNWLEAVTMNLAVPPFNDIHVRKAVALILDHAAMVDALGGTTIAEVATHIYPPVMVDDQLTSSYNPYATPGEHGDLQAAEAQMRLSRYDPRHDGKCDVSVCKNLIFINAQGQFTAIDPIVQADLAKIGVDIVPRDLETGAAFTSIMTMKNQIPMSALGGGFADYADGYGFAEAAFSSSALAPAGCCNYSWVGMTKAQAKQFGVPYPANGIPSVDSQINTCEALAGEPRIKCWVAFDKDLMTKVVAWVPYMWGNYVSITAPDVTRYVVEQWTDSIDFTQIAVSNHATP
jgi:peptide/nickel transport system substrate-binding protein